MTTTHKMIVNYNYTIRKSYAMFEGVEELSWVYKGIDIPLTLGGWIRFA